MLRIITGTAKNKKLDVPSIINYRGVQDVAKGALFSIIGDKVLNTTCLDLYAGSGTLGLEALSRGAHWCDFVDNHKTAVQVIENNLKKCDFVEKAELFFKDAVKFAVNADKRYNLIFVDPYYDDLNHIFLMQNLEEILLERGIITFFHGEQLNVDKIISKTKLKIINTRRFGKSFFTIYSH